MICSQMTRIVSEEQKRILCFLKSCTFCENYDYIDIFAAILTFLNSALDAQQVIIPTKYFIIAVSLLIKSYSVFFVKKCQS